MKSTLTVDKLVVGAKQKGFTSIALTDEHVLHGAVQFYKKCMEEGLKPIIGLKLRVKVGNETTTSTEPDSTFFIILLAKSNKGYQQLLELSTQVGLQETDALFIEEIVELTSDLFVVLPVQQKPFSLPLMDRKMDFFDRTVNQLRDSVPNNHFYVGIQEHHNEEKRIVNTVVKEYCEAKGQEGVVLQDVRYLQAEDYLAYDCLQHIREQKKWSHDKPMPESKYRHLVSASEIEGDYLDFWPNAIENSVKIAEKCNVTLTFNQQILPSYPTPNEMTSRQYLQKLCLESMNERFTAVEPKVVDRLNYELEVINKMDFNDYFLIVWDFMNFARNNDILTGPGRGSAAGSLVSYLLKITDVDPIENELLFERFLNPERISMPDIDIDFSDHRRDEVIKYVQQKYGQERVAQIVTFGTFGTRSLLRELIKTMSIDTQEAAFLLKSIPQQSASLESIVRESQELKDYVKQSEKLKLMFKIAFKLEGLPRHHSTHAAGVIISKEKLTNLVPLMKGHQEIALTQFPMGDLEEIGLLKMDFLGLRNLSLMEQIVKRIQRKKDKNFNLDQIPLQDAKTFKLLQEGKTTGVFQLESAGMRKVLQDLKPTQFEDVVAVNALYRPGPMEFIPNYIKRKHGEEKVIYPHADLKPILEKTFGVLIYQEQIMQIANRFAGLSLGEADSLRRAISKKNKEVIQREKAKFRTGCIQNGYSSQVADEVYDWIERFANYGFNRSHAVAYSKIAYQLAYLKAHYPSFFFAALLSSVSFDQEKVRQYIREANQFGIKVLPPSINHSLGIFTVENTGSIRMALPVVKGVGKQAIEEILRVRKDKPFQSIFDFCQRVSLKTINRSIMESLVLAGAFDETNINRATLLASLDQAIEQGELFGGLNNQDSLFGDDLLLEPSYTETENFPPLKQLAFEKEVLGMYLSSHPLSSFRNKLQANGYHPLATIKEFHIGNNAKSVVAVQDIKVIRTKRGDSMAFVTIADETDEMEGVIFPNLYREINRWLKEEMIIFISGKVEIRQNRPQWLINEVKPFKSDELKKETNHNRMYVKFSHEDERAQLSYLKDVSHLFPGSTPVVVHSTIRNETFQLASTYNISPSQPCMKKLKEYFGEEFVVLQRL